MPIERKIGIAGAKDALVLLENSFGKDKYFYTWNSYIHVADWAIGVYKKSIDSNKKIICAETPYIGREFFSEAKNKQKNEIFVRVGWNDVSTYHPKHFNIYKQFSPERIEKILKNQNKKMSPEWRKNGDHILIATQVPNDSSLWGIDQWATLQYELIKLRQHTDRKILITLHPEIQKGWAKSRFNNSKSNFEKFKQVVGMVGAEISNKPSKELLKNCWCVICFTSGFTFDAIVRGIPTITLHNRSFAAPISSKFVEEIENPRLEDRIQWLSNIAYCEWSLEEIKQNKCKEHLLK